VAVDLLDGKLEAAGEFGALHTINAAEDCSVAVAVKGLTEGRGADYAFVTVGSSEAVTQGLGLIRRQGTVVIVGLPEAGTTLQMPVWSHAVSEHRIMGSLVESTRLSVHVPWLVQIPQNRRLMLDELITAWYPLDKINEAIESAESGEALRNVIVFSPHQLEKGKGNEPSDRGH
jgi:S-(hydroxymethyl)glutathione dehydrogenase/alcohol dehydrogenase